MGLRARSRLFSTYNPSGTNNRSCSPARPSAWPIGCRRTSVALGFADTCQETPSVRRSRDANTNLLRAAIGFGWWRRRRERSDRSCLVAVLELPSQETTEHDVPRPVALDRGGEPARELLGRERPPELNRSASRACRRSRRAPSPAWWAHSSRDTSSAREASRSIHTPLERLLWRRCRPSRPSVIGDMTRRRELS